MKRFFSLLLVLLLCGLLTACGGKEAQTVYEVNGFTIDKAAQTITKDETVYTYDVSGSTITITYPNGAEYFWTYWENGGYGGCSGDYDPDRYADGPALLKVISYQPPRESGRYFGIGLLLAAAGLFNLVSPRIAWYLRYGWRFKDSEPSEAALVFGRVGGGVVLIFGILTMLL